MLKIMTALVAASMLVTAAHGQSRKNAVAAARHTVYVPVYSTIPHGDRERDFNLSVTLSVRNVNRSTGITIERVVLYDESGRIIAVYLDTPRALGGLGTVRFVIKESDRRGGAGASFLVTWSSRGKAVPPLVETVMIGTAGQQGISFTSRGVPVD